MADQQERAARHPRRPVRPREDVEEPLRPLQVDDQHDGRRQREDHGHDRAADADERRSIAQEPEQRRQEHRAGRDALEQQVEHEVDAPRPARAACRSPRADRPGAPDPAPARRAGAAAPGPSWNMNGRAAISGRIDALVGAEIEDLRARALLGLAHHERLALHDLRDLARRIVEVAEDAALGRAHADARRLQLVLDPVRAEVALLGGVRVRIDEQLIVRARRHARAAPDARVAVQIDDAVAAAEEGVGRADVHARRVVALIAEHREEQPLRVAGTCPSRPSSPSSGSRRPGCRARPCTRSCRRGSRCTSADRWQTRSGARRGL